MVYSLSSAPAGRFDISIFASTLLIAAVCSGAGLVGAKEPPTAYSVVSSSSPQTYEGVISDTRCGARHNTAIGLTAGDCTIQCIRMGEQFALVDGETIYVLGGDQQVLKRAAGQRVKISGALTGNRLEVKSVSPD
jgi:hypothetical protein